MSDRQTDPGDAPAEDEAGYASELLAAYLLTAERWDSVQSNATQANKEFDELRRLYRLLRVEPRGREGIEKLMEHPNKGVRLSAASHALAWSPDRASEMLEEIASGKGLHAVSAHYTLLSYRSGKLNLDR
jgi:Domain of unknown function (DUF2019)